MTQVEVLHSWLVRAKTVECAHFEFCLIYKRRHYIWGGLLIAASALSSALTAIFEQDGIDLAVPVIAFTVVRIMLALFVPVSAAVVTFLKHEARSAKHHDAAARFASIKRRISLLLARITDGENIKLAPELEKIAKEWDELTLSMPAIPKSKGKWSDALNDTEEHYSLDSKYHPKATMKQVVSKVEA